MVSTFDKYKEHINELMKKRSIITSLVLTCILSYGFTITNFSIGIDDTAFFRYFKSSGLLAQGRFGATVLDKVFDVFEFSPFWMDMVAVSILFIAALVWCSIFMEITKNKLNTLSYIIFSTVFISYPIINEIFIYMMASVPICLGYLLTGIALIYTYEWVIKKRSKINGVTAALIMTFTISLSEAFAPVFICGVFMILILISIYSDKTQYNLKQYFNFFISSILILALGVILESIIANIINILFNIEKSNVAATGIEWFNGNGIINNLILLIKTIVYNYFFVALNNKSIFIFDIACIITACLGIGLWRKKNSITYFLLFLGLGLSNISLSVIQGYASPYRTCMTFALFIGFIFMVLYNQLSYKNLKRVLVLAVFIIVIIQSHELSQRFYNDFRRYSQDKQVAIQTATIINYEFDNTKPVVFLGRLDKYTNVKIGQTNGNSVVSWGVKAFGENGTELLNFMMMHGYHFNQATDEQVSEAALKSKDMPIYPKKGYVQEFDEYIVVKFGEEY